MIKFYQKSRTEITHKKVETFVATIQKYCDDTKPNDKRRQASSRESFPPDPLDGWQNQTISLEQQPTPIVQYNLDDVYRIV